MSPLTARVFTLSSRSLSMIATTLLMPAGPAMRA